MSSSPMLGERHLANLSQYPTLPIDRTELSASLAEDEALNRQLALHNQHIPRFDPNATGFSFYNQDIAERVRPVYTPEASETLERHLYGEGTLHIPTIKAEITVNGAKQDILIMPATETGDDGANHGDMSEIWYLRDQAQAAIGVIRLATQNPERYGHDLEFGKHLLMSVVHGLSTDTQLKRFQTCIELGPKAGQEDWPHISLLFKDLEGTGPNGWRNEQDSLQMVMDAVLESFQIGALDIDELDPANKQFLGSVIPLLKATGHPLRESSGSWEELKANRTSVMAVEASLLDRTHQLLLTEHAPALDFLEDGYRAVADRLPHGTEKAFKDVVLDMMVDGLMELGQRLPYESSEYTKNTLEDRVKYREADAALTYVLMYRIPQLLEQYTIPVQCNNNEPMAAEAVEHIVLRQVQSLQDEQTGGIRRYEGDSYQRPDFHTNAVQLIIRAIKHFVKGEAKHKAEQEYRATGKKPKPEIDLVQKQHMRNELTPQGPEAPWLHPLAQLSSWAAERSLDEIGTGNIDRARHYHDLSTSSLNCLLSNVTGDNQHNVVLNSSGKYQINKVRKSKIPECMPYHSDPDTGELFAVPSAHTALNWAAAATRRAVGMHGESTRKLYVLSAQSYSLTGLGIPPARIKAERFGA